MDMRRGQKVRENVYIVNNKTLIVVDAVKRPSEKTNKYPKLT